MKGADPEEILAIVAEEFTACLRVGKTPSVAAFVDRYPEYADEIEELLASISLMEQLSRSESDFREQANVASKSAPSLERLGDFDIVREIGRGGMGVVFEAVDRSLNRRVALKVLNDSTLTTQKHIDRFRRESQLAARLHHTNIVSVFGVGEDNGKHFFAMQFVEGVSLQEILDGLRRRLIEETDSAADYDPASAIEVAAALRAGRYAEARRIHSDVGAYSSQAMESVAIRSSARSANGSSFEQTFERSDAMSGSVEADALERPRVDTSHSTAAEVCAHTTTGPEGFDRAYWRSVARIGVQIADAIHYAHVNGILHRDIKPANLMFDADGTVWVADFGLAKLGESHDLTKTGDVVGTLKYMAPEQLDGLADVRTDIYSLGLTLYELLTLRPVCDGETYKELFAQKQNSSHLAPRKIDPAIPRDLEKIVQKTLASESDKRYASARELADDLQRFLDDRPVHARRVTFAEQVWRWCRRNRVLASLTATAAGLLLVLTLVMGMAYVREKQQNERMETVLNVVLGGFDDLFGSYLQNDSATTAALSDASGDGSLAPAMLTRDTAKVLEKLLVVYDRLAETTETSTSSDLAVESAKARHRVGDLYQRLGQFEKAATAYEDAARLFTQLSCRDPARHIDVARTHQAIGAIHEQTQNTEAAETEYQLALESLAQAPAIASAIFETARTHYLLGKRPSLEGGRPDEGMPGPPGAMHHRGRGPQMGWLATSNRERAEHLERATELLLADENADKAEYQLLLTICLRELAHVDMRGEGSGEASSKGYLELLTELADRFPDVPRYQFELWETHRKLGADFHGSDSETCLNHLLMAQQLGERLVAEQRDVAPYRINLAHTYAFLGVEYGHRGDVRRAEQFTKLAMETHRSVVVDFPGLAPLSNRLSRNDAVRLGEWLLAIRRYEELVELLQPLADQVDEELAASGSSPSQSPTLDDPALSRTLRRCAELLLPAYDALQDNVGYLIAHEWLRPKGPLEYGTRHEGPPPPPPPSGRPQSPLDMALSYDLNGDGLISRAEVPHRMSFEWFRRFDTDKSETIDRNELDSLRW